jgi:pilus assembly protein CpaB
MSSLPRRLAFFFLALFIAGLMVMFVKQWVHSAVATQPGSAGAVAETKPVDPPVMVLVAKGDIAAGTFLNAEMMSWQEWPRDSVNDSYVVKDKAKLEDYVGTVVRARLTSGEPITPARVVHPGDRGFLAAVLTPGMRAVTVNVTPSTGLAGFVSPGDHVDLILTMVVHPDKEQKDDPDRHMSETVLTDLRVLGMDQRISDDKKDIAVPKTATLEVTPKQAEIVAVSADLGLLSLSLRSVAEDDYPPAMHPTWDSEATRLPINMPHVEKRKVDVVRGSVAAQVATPTALSGSEK